MTSTGKSREEIWPARLVLIGSNVAAVAIDKNKVMTFETGSGDLRNGIIKAAKELGLEAIIKPANPEAINAKISIYGNSKYAPLAKGKYFVGEDYAGVLLKKSKNFKEAAKFKALVNEYSGINAEMKAIREGRYQ